MSLACGLILSSRSKFSRSFASFPPLPPFFFFFFGKEENKKSLSDISERLFHQHWSGRRGSNSRQSAWKADALPTELLPQEECGRRWIRTTEVVRQQIYSLPHLATLVFARIQRTALRLQIYAIILIAQALSLHFFSQNPSREKAGVFFCLRWRKCRTKTIYLADANRQIDNQK